MVLSKTSFLKFLDSVKLKGDLETKEVIFNFEKTKITVICRTSNNVLALSGEYNGEFEAVGAVGIGDLSQFRGFVASFSSDVLELKIVKNKIVLTSPEEQLQIKMIITNPEYISVQIPEDKFKSFLAKGSGNEIVLKKEVVQKIVGYCNTIKANTVLLTGKNNQISVSVSEMDNDITAGFPVEGLKQEFKIQFQASYLTNLFSVVPEEVIISAITNTLLIMKLSVLNFNINYVLAPIEIKE